MQDVFQASIMRPIVPVNCATELFSLLKAASKIPYKEGGHRVPLQLKHELRSEKVSITD